MKNVIKKATCFTKENQSLLDVAVTTKPRSVLCHGNVDTGLSDVHNMIYVMLKLHSKVSKKKPILYRSYKHFDVDKFKWDLSQQPFHMLRYMTNMDEAYTYFQDLVVNVLNTHAPVKTRYTRDAGAPFINSDLRKAIYKKRMLYKKFIKKRSPENWENYRAQRNKMYSNTKTVHFKVIFCH
jgi:hypothetical protein